MESKNGSTFIVTRKRQFDSLPSNVKTKNCFSFCHSNYFKGTVETFDGYSLSFRYGNESAGVDLVHVIPICIKQWVYKTGLNF